MDKAERAQFCSGDVFVTQTRSSAALVSLRLQASLKKFMDYIQTSAVDKMVKFMDKGLDPNFQDADTGGKERNPPLFCLHKSPKSVE